MNPIGQGYPVLGNILQKNMLLLVLKHSVVCCWTQGLGSSIIWPASLIMWPASYDLQIILTCWSYRMFFPMKCTNMWYFYSLLVVALSILGMLHSDANSLCGCFLILICQVAKPFSIEVNQSYKPSSGEHSLLAKASDISIHLSSHVMSMAASIVTELLSNLKVL